LEAVLDLVNRHPDELKQMKQTIEGMLKWYIIYIF
jgi:hypothetical protein